ncbi:MAG: ParB/RepB/Spo0J family partition protein [Acholeplasma sp.]|nr:ParB/RepB/Spo0J family partition protein [Acholeplasma sp.]
MQIDRRVVDLDINDVLPNRFQPRIKFNEISIQELSDSIKKYGVIQPIVVRKIGDKYEIIAGERRYKASVMAGKTTIPAIISDLNDKDSVEIALIENVQREDLTPIEKAISYRKILDMGYMNQEELAEKIGKSQSAIANTLRLLTLSEEVQEALLEVKISERHARSLLKLKNEKDQVKMLNRIINERLTVRRTDEEIEKMMFDEEPIRIDDDANTNVPFQNVPLEQPSQPEILPINEVPTTPVYDVQEEPSLVDVPVTPIYEAPEVPKYEPYMYEPYTEPVQETYEAPEVPKYEPYTEPVQETYETPEVPKYEPSEPVQETYETPEVPMYEPSTEPVQETYEAPEVPMYEPSTEPVQETYETPEVPMYEPSTEPVQETYETPEVPKYEPSTEPVQDETYETPEVPMYEPSTEPAQETYETPEVPKYEPSTEPVQESEYDIPTDLSNNSFTDLNLPDFETDTEQNNEYSDMPSFMNISQIEKNAEDIIKPEKPLVDMDELLKPDANMPANENNQDDESESDNGEILKPGKFFNFFDNEETIDEPEEQVSTNQFDLNNFYTEDNNAQTDEVRNEEQPAPVPTNNTYVANDIKTGINTIHDCIKTLEKYGFKVNMEELDLNDKYQIMLDIDKK